MKKLSVKQLAIQDIAKDMKENNISVHDDFHDVWVVTASLLMADKEQTKLNKELGLNKINYFGNKNNKTLDK